MGNMALLGSKKKLTSSQPSDELTIEAPRNVPDDMVVVLKITLRG